MAKQQSTLLHPFFFFIWSLCTEGISGTQVMLLPVYFKYKHGKKYSWQDTKGACTLLCKGFKTYLLIVKVIGVRG